jgi:trans-aconitate 2-methyltransferase
MEISMSDTWSPSLYSRFEDERTRPSRDLLAQVPLMAPKLVFDMGCGPGNSTELLVERFPEAEVVGLDNSANMLEEARRRVPRARFDVADASNWVPDNRTDLVFANAIYQWVPEHLSVLPRVLAALPRGGVLAVQVPDNFMEPSHEAMRAVAADGAWAERLAGAPRPKLAPVREFYDALKPHAAHVDIWHTVYNHVLADAAAIVEWVKGTGLRPFIDPLTQEERAEFIARYQARVTDAYRPTADGKVLLRFPRLFMVAQR